MRRSWVQFPSSAPNLNINIYISYFRGLDFGKKSIMEYNLVDDEDFINLGI